MDSDYQSGIIRFACQFRSDVGRVRKNNEDALIEAPEIGLMGVCDGLGGHAAGEVASALASDTFKEILGSANNNPSETLARSVTTANEKILQRQVENPAYRGMGTTVSLIWLAGAGDGKAWIAHLGDSRIYHFRKDVLSQITQDHSPVFRLFQQGILTKDQTREHPQKNLVEKSLGISSLVQPDIFQVQLQASDRILICTDGLTDSLADREIGSIIGSRPLAEASDDLVERANEKGGFDNISLVLLEIHQSSESDG